MLTYRKNARFGMVTIPANKYTLLYLEALIRKFASDNEINDSTHIFDIVETFTTTINKVPTIIVQFAILKLPQIK